MSDDLIRRSDAIKAYNEAMDELVKWQMEEWQLGDFSECEFNTTDCKHIVRKIEAIPSADRPQGYWTKTDVATYRCSECGKKQIADDVNELNYCCCCGSRNKVRRDKGADDEDQ